MKINLLKSNSRFTARQKLFRFCWNIIWSIVSILPRPASNLRIYILKIFGAKIGKNCLIEEGVKVLMPWNLKIADFVAIGRKVEIYNYGFVSIDSMTVISQYSYICTGSHDYQHPYMPLIWDDIYIGSECWIAAGTWIMPGVKIGNGAVIGAKSLVNKDMPGWMVCAGHPCKVLKEREINDFVESSLTN